MEVQVAIRNPQPVVPPTTYDITFKGLSRQQVAALKALMSPHIYYRTAVSTQDSDVLHLAMVEGFLKQGIQTYGILTEVYGVR